MTTPFDAPDWRTMSQEDRDLGLNNGVAVAGSAEIVAGWERRSAEMRARYPDHLDLRYGPRERNRIDFLQGRATRGRRCCSSTAATGRSGPRRSFTLFAEGPMAHGINVALIGYTLAPDATLDEIVAEIHAGIDFLAGQLPALGGDGNGIVVSGWSAGGHLTSMALSHPQVRGGDGDIRHLRSRADPRQLSQRQARPRRGDVAPQLADDAGRRCAKAAVAGGRSAELPLLRKQTADFAGHRARYGLPVTYEEIPGANHFTIMDEMMSPQGRITTLIRQLFERTA